MTYAFGADITAEPLSLPLVQLNNRRLTLSFKPATAADEQALQALLPEGPITDPSQLPASIPAYLIQVVPELKLGGQVLKTGAAMRLGDELPFLTQLRHAGRSLPPKHYNVIAGSYLAVAADSGNISPAELQAVRDRLSHTKATLETADPMLIGSLTREDLLGDLFHAGLLGYYAQFIGLAHVLGLRQHGHYTLAAGTGTYGYEPKVSYFLGIPRALLPGGAVMNIPIVHIAGQDANDPAKKRDYLFQVGLISSALEHAVPEQMFVNEQNPGEAISAVKALQKANAQGQRIYHLTPDNQGSILPNIHHTAYVMDEIRNALNAGKEVITHTDAVSVPGWTGAGYILFDPNTGDGAFKIAGGQNGGNYSAESVGLLTLAFISIFATGGVFSLSLIGALAAYLTIVAAVIGVLIIVHELIEDPEQFGDERGQITYIIGAALGLFLAPLQGVGAGTAAQELWTAIGWIIGMIIGLLGAV